MEKQGKIQTGLRIPADRYEELCRMAERSGASLNSIVLMLVDVGMRVVNLHPVQEEEMEQVHSFLRNQQCTSE